MITGEDASIFHVGEQMKNRGYAFIKSLYIAGNTERDADKIEEEVVNYFQKLYPASDVTSDNSFHPQKTVDVNLPANNDLMNHLTEQELLLTIKVSRSRKSRA